MKRPAVPSLLLAVAVLGVLAVLGTRTSPRPTADDRSVAREERAAPADDGPTRDVSADPTSRAAAATPAVDGNPAGPAAPVESPAAAAPERSLELCDLGGSAVRLGPDGQEHTADDGSFAIHWRRDGVFERRDVDVVGGSWTVRVPVDVELHVQDFVLADVVLTVDEPDFAVPRDRFRVLVGREQHGVLLHVVSPDGAELDGVDVWWTSHTYSTNVMHPGAGPKGERVVASARSPVTIPPREGAWRTATLYFARAPGHAWSAIAIDHAASGERTLRLEPTCRLEVELIGNAEWLEPEIRLWLPETPSYAANSFSKLEPDEAGRGVFEDLPPGDYVASVERGWGDQRAVYGSAAVTLVAGDRAHTTIEVELPERPVPVRVSGTLTLPGAWERDRIEIVLGAEDEARVWSAGRLSVPLGSMARAEGASGADDERFLWEAELPVAGPYRLEVSPLPVRRLLDVPEAGLADVDVVVPPPADVSVRVIDDATGDEIEVESLHWSAPQVEGILSTTLQSAVADPETGAITFRTAAGGVELSPRDPSLVPVDRTRRYEVAEGENRIEFRVHRQIGVRFTFMDGEAEIPWDWSWRLGARQVDGEARDTSRSIGVLWFRESGLYELTSDGIPGYASIDGTTFRAQAADGGMVEVEVRLTPE